MPDFVDICNHMPNLSAYALLNIIAIGQIAREKEVSASVTEFLSQMHGNCGVSMVKLLFIPDDYVRDVLFL